MIMIIKPITEQMAARVLFPNERRFGTISISMYRFEDQQTGVLSTMMYQFYCGLFSSLALDVKFQNTSSPPTCGGFQLFGHQLAVSDRATTKPMAKSVIALNNRMTPGIQQRTENTRRKYQK